MGYPNKDSLHIPFPSWAKDGEVRDDRDFENWKELMRWADRQDRRGNLTANPIGQLLVMQASSVTIPDGGGYVEFQEILYQNGFAETVAAGTSIIWPTVGGLGACIGGIQLEMAWDDFEGAASIEAEVNDVVPAWGTIGTGAGPSGRGYIPTDIDGGATVRIKVSQSSGAAQGLSMTARFHVQSPAEPLPAPDPIVAPTSLASVTKEATSNGPVTINHIAPTCQVGDLMVAVWTGYSLSQTQGTDGSATPDPLWTLRYNGEKATYRCFTKVYTKVADADDVAGTRTYAWSHGGSAVYTSLAAVTIPQANGTTIAAVSGSRAVDTLSHTTGTPAGGDWILGIMTGKVYRASADEQATPTISTTGATQMLSWIVPSGRSGRIRIYTIPADAASITGSIAYVENPFGAIIGMAVTA